MVGHSINCTYRLYKWWQLFSRRPQKAAGVWTLYDFQPRGLVRLDSWGLDQPFESYYQLGTSWGWIRWVRYGPADRGLHIHLQYRGWTLYHCPPTSRDPIPSHGG